VSSTLADGPDGLIGLLHAGLGAVVAPQKPENQDDDEGDQDGDFDFTFHVFVFLDWL